MMQFKLILIFFLFIVSTIYASVVRPFDFEKWNFKKDIDLAYVLMHDVDNGILIKSQDKAGNIKSQEILAKLNKLKAYSDSLQKIIKNRLARSRFQKEVELPLFKIVRKYKYLTRNYKNKKFIENPEYTKLILEKNIKKAVFLENYFRSRIKNVKSRKEIEKRINTDQSSFKPPKDKTSSSLKSKFSSSKNSKSPQGLKKCNKRRILKKYGLNRAVGELLDDLENEDLEDLENEDLEDLENEDLEDLENEDLEDLENEDLDEPYSEDYGFTEEAQDEDEF
ncbi:hypothetical protein [Borreliella bavariensis]|uniref:hypothetical protein n=1 Tax=Borreliella bavariensis TaxID=664662 RepID=UPI001C00619D|nr:hypothetical protein [Borreliella bavariensis]